MPGFRKAISPLLATVILIAITVAGGLLVYNVFFNTAGTVSTQLQVSVVSCDLVRAGSRTLLSITVRNDGSKPIYSLNVTIWDGGSTQRGPYSLYVGSNPVSQNNPLAPGGCASASLTEAQLGTNFVAGNKYPVRIDALASDGSTFRHSFVVTCTG
ncbi:MAG: archaellin/type IV pilin N-terminal domain-containing protein [Thermofilum sp.]